MRRILNPLMVLLTIILFCGSSSMNAKNLKGIKLDFVCQDSVFKNPFIDMDKTINTPVKCRYIHGGFDDGTRFSFYFPEKAVYAGHFYQYLSPYPDSETSSQMWPRQWNPICFSIDHGAYFVETNSGGRLDFTDSSTRRESSISGYRANAACAELSRYVAKLIYNCERPYGYAYGGSGGAYRATGSAENTEGIWDGIVPYVLGSAHATPNVFGVRMHALRILQDKMPDIVDALEPGGSGNPYATLTAEEAETLREATRMGFPIKSWYGWRYMDAHGFLVLYQGVVAQDPEYFRNDFWNRPGYLGYDNPRSLEKDHIKVKTIVKRIIGQTEGERLGLVRPMSDADKGTADQAWRNLTTSIEEKPVAYEVDVELKSIGLGGDIIMLTGEGKGQRLQVGGTKGRYVTLAGLDAMQKLTLLHVGDSVQVDNSDWLAVQTHYRHQMPGKEFYAWNQFRGYNDQPIYPQRDIMVAPSLAKDAAGGNLPDGNIHGKMIVCESVWDREAFAWQADWYYTKVKEHLGEKADDNFRLWYTDRATHGGEDDPTEVVEYMSTLFQALLDISDWCEKGIEPSHTSTYQIEDAQVILGEDGSARGGVQPVPYASIDGKERADVKVGEEVTIHVVVDVPKGTGKVVKAEWCFDESKRFTTPVDLSQARYSSDGEHVEFDATVSYDKPGTYFPTVKVYNQREGNANDIYTCIPNLGKVRVVVK